MQPQKYQTTIEKIGPTTLISPIPEKSAKRFLDAGQKRVTVEIKGQVLHCAIHNRHDVGYFFYFGKQVWKRLGISEGDQMEIIMRPDNSEYQAQIPEELEAVLSTDEEGILAFEALTPGRKRSIIFMISRLKKVDTRIQRSLKVVEKLKMGITDLKDLLR